MEDNFHGLLGHFFIILSFVSALAVAWAYYRQSNIKNDNNSWLGFARITYGVHVAAVIAVIFILFFITAKHKFQYHYVWNYSSRSLPGQYILSSFWHGQEGSFLLWIFWNAVLGLIVIKISNKKWEAPVMTIFAIVQVFLCSMLLGVVLPGIDLKIGSSPFLLLKEAMPELPVWQMNANFVPEDGKGMNPLLQNYWMVIHPPTLFLGFATTLVPFSYMIAGLWQGKYSEWIKPSLAWSIVSALILGIGILMGAYWAYETLNFGGYWNWDPVENAVYVPWLVMVAAIHTQIANRNSGTAIKASIILIISQFILILYSTFLTRSGILGNASVHSFTDLGLSGQLLIYMFTFVAISVAICVYHWKKIPTDTREYDSYSREFWIFMGATVLCLAAFQVIFTTSIPVFNKIAESLGFVSNMALPADPIAHYSKFQLWAFIIIAILTGIGQYVWWGRLKKLGWFKAFVNTALTAFILTAIIINVEHVYNIEYGLLLFAGLFSIIGNGTIIFNMLKGNYKLSGGAVTHIGVALMLLGVLFSAGYSKVVSLNASGLTISNKDEAFTKNNDKENKENISLWQNVPQKMAEYTLTYKGMRMKARSMPNYLKPNQIEVIEGDFRAIAMEDLTAEGKVYYKTGDTLEIFDENRYYEIDFRDDKGKITTLYPRFQLNKQMGNVSSPALKHKFSSDIYTYVSLAPNLEEREWSKTEQKAVSVQDTFFINDYVAQLQGIQRITSVKDVQLGPNDVAVKAVVKVMGPNFREYMLEPTYIIKDGLVAMPPFENEELGIRIRLSKIDPQTGLFSFAINTTQRDYVVIKALEKPWINLLWIGTGILVIGMLMAAVRRYKDMNIA
jgi:cytochrome c-type biogenesis protein CcmF